ncbi:MAG: patatin-like phospholipase family protein [Clostridia bacterium]|nr:patatin-like phospholipase family protein [Clostridia bacterium]
MRVGLALGAGGLRGAALVGVLSVFAEAGLRMDILTGTSAGALVAVLAAALGSPAELRRLVEEVRPQDLFDPSWRPLTLCRVLAKSLLDAVHLPSRWLGPVPLGLLRGERLERFVEERSGCRCLDALDVPVGVAATDVVAGRPVFFVPVALASTVRRRIPDAAVLTGVRVGLAVRASAAIPGVFEPVRLGSLLLVDGALVDDVPARLARAMGADFVIAVSLRRTAGPEPVPDDVLELLFRSHDVAASTLSWLRTGLAADFVLAPELPAVPLHRLDLVPALMEAGSRAARQALPSLRDALGRRPRALSAR